MIDLLSTVHFFCILQNKLQTIEGEKKRERREESGAHTLLSKSGCRG